jgi:hypothetical protein
VLALHAAWLTLLHAVWHRPAKLREVLEEVVSRIILHYACTGTGSSPFPQQEAWLAAVRQDPSAKAALRSVEAGLARR